MSASAEVGDRFDDVNFYSSALAYFRVFGNPAAQGSKRIMRGNLVESGGEKLRLWRSAVAEKANEIALRMVDANAPLDGALDLDVSFRFPMPKTRPLYVREKGQVVKTSAPDLDKLLRAVFDGLVAGGLIHDDRQVGAVYANKLEVVGWTGVQVRIGRP